jgi:hypothetical protein
MWINSLKTRAKFSAVHLLQRVDPHGGRFISSDPIGLAGGVNLYQYAPNPIAWIDPLRWAAANGANAPSHGGTGHNQIIDDHIVSLQQEDGVTNIRKNQQQVDLDGNKVGANRPDIKYDQDGRHYNVEYDTDSKASANHQTRVTANDPNARSTFWEIDSQGNKTTGRSSC